MMTSGLSTEMVRGGDLDAIDEEQVLDLLTYLPQSNPADLEKVQRQLLKMQQSDQCHLSVAREASGLLVAMATINYLHTPNVSYGFIDAVVKLPEAPRGLGRMVTANALDHAFRKEDVDKVMLTSRERNVAAQAMYRGLGFYGKDTDVFVITQEQWSPDAS